MTLSKQIRTRRKELRITQVELAKAAGASQSMISKIEAGKLVPSLDEADKIFKALKMSVTIGVKE